MLRMRVEPSFHGKPQRWPKLVPRLNGHEDARVVFACSKDHSAIVALN